MSDVIRRHPIFLSFPSAVEKIKGSLGDKTTRTRAGVDERGKGCNFTARSPRVMQRHADSILDDPTIVSLSRHGVD